ncbi:MAG: hypothetical protein AABW83_01940 [Nanoarchaeota archaeon]
MGRLNRYGAAGSIIKNILEKLNVDERDVYCLTNGLGDGYCYSYYDVSKILKMRENDVRAIEEIAEYKFKRFK